MRSAVFVAVCAVIASFAAAQQATLLYEWVSVDYDWTGANRSAAIASGAFIPEHNAIAGVKLWKDDIYVTVPRWRTGVPSTLNKIVTIDGSAVLQPFPSWDWNDPMDPSKLQYIQSMEIDSQGNMWILDVGRLNIFSNVSTDVMNFAPKLVVYNLDSNTVLRTFVFPNDVAPYNSSFLNDIVVDELNHVAYISDTGVVGGIIVYDWTSNSARRWGGDVTQQFDPTYTVIINGVEYPTVRNNADGIALSTDLQTLYYCVVDGNHLFSIPTRYLRDFGTTDDFLHSQVTVVGQKLSASDGMAVDSSGRLYFGSFSNSAVVSWDPSTPLTPQTQTILCSDAEQMQWQDTFAFDNQGNLYFTTNRLQAYFLNTMDFSGASGSNFRLFKVNINAESYLAAENPGYFAALTAKAQEDGIIPAFAPSLALDTVLSVQYSSDNISFTYPCNMSTLTYGPQQFSIDPLSNQGVLGSVLVRDPPLVNWSPANYSQFYHLFLVDIDFGFLHRSIVNIPGSAVGLGYHTVHYFQPSPADSTPHRYVWGLFRTDFQIVIPASEALDYFNSPVFSRSSFNMTSYATSHGFSPIPIGLLWESVSCDPYTAFSWATIFELTWIPQSTRDTFNKMGFLGNACKNSMGK